MYAAQNSLLTFRHAVGCFFVFGRRIQRGYVERSAFLAVLCLWYCPQILAEDVAGTSVHVAGRVTSTEGNVPPGLQVFCEPGIADPLVAATVQPDGSFAFPSLPPGALGIFAVADGYAFSGEHLNAAPGDKIENVSLVLTRPGRIAGRVRNEKKDPVAGVLVFGAVLLAEKKVGIPFAKLQRYGFPLVRTDDKGRFEVICLPEGARVALKFQHPSYAQEGVHGIPVGGEDVEVVLFPGVWVEGEVLRRSSKEALPNVPVIIRNAQPPFESVVAVTAATGSFGVRLKPGVYMCKVTLAEEATPGWQPLIVADTSAHKRLQVFVERKGQVVGSVGDAVSGKPVPGVRVALLYAGGLAEIAQTDKDGKFWFRVGAGDYTVQLMDTVGYKEPPQGAYRVTVAADKTVELPGLWLTPESSTLATSQ